MTVRPFVPPKEGVFQLTEAAHARTRVGLKNLWVEIFVTS